MAEASTAVKAGSSVLAALTDRTGQAAWPNMHESLLTLHAALSEWCDAAHITNSAVKLEFNSRDPSGRRARTERIRQSITQLAQIGTYLHDIDELMRPRVRLVERWSKKSRRAAARRGLKTLLDVYAPELRIDIHSAAEARRELLDACLGAGAWGILKKMSDKELVQLDGHAERTYKDLLAVTNRLAQFIVIHFPLDGRGNALLDRRGNVGPALFEVGWSWGAEADDTQAENGPR